MATQVLQPSAALYITHHSDDYDIPFHMQATKGYTTDVGFSQLKDGTADFISLGIEQGMMVWNTTAGLSAIVVSVSLDILFLDADIFASAGDAYIVFSTKNPGCLIRIGNGKNDSMCVTTSGGDKVTFFNLNSGTILPVRVLRVWSANTTVSELVALW